MFHIKYLESKECNLKCIFQEEPDVERFDMRHSSQLKTITIFHEQNPELFIFGGRCHDAELSVKFLNIYIYITNVIEC